MVAPEYINSLRLCMAIIQTCGAYSCQPSEFRPDRHGSCHPTPMVDDNSVIQQIAGVRLDKGYVRYLRVSSLSLLLYLFLSIRIEELANYLFTL